MLIIQTLSGWIIFLVLLTKGVLVSIITFVGFMGRSL